MGDHVDATAFDEDSRLIFCSNGEGTISVIIRTAGQVLRVETVKTLRALRRWLWTPRRTSFLVCGGGGAV